MGHIINNIIEYNEGDTLSLENKFNPRFSNLRLVTKTWNKLIEKKWKTKSKIINLLNDTIYQLEYTLESGECSGCMCFLKGVSGGENQLAHYGGCFADDYESENEFEERKSNLKIGNVKFKDYQNLKRKRENELYSYQENKKVKLQLHMDNNV